MATNINTLPGPVSPSTDSSSADQFIRKMVVMCDEHGVAWGTPQRLAGFIEALRTNKHMAMDFWSTVARMSDEGSGVGPNRVLEVIVEGVTGRSIAEVMVTGRAERGAVGDLTRLLSGEDVWSPVTESPQSSRRFEVSEDSEGSPQTNDNIEKAPASSDVEHAINDVERGEELAGEVASAAPPAPRTHRASWTSPPPPPSPTSTPSPTPPLPFTSVPLSPRQQYPVRVRSDDPFVRVPLGAYAERENKRTRRAPIVGMTIGILLLLAGGGAFLMRGETLPYWQKFEATVRRAFSGGATSDSVQSAVNNNAAENSPVAAENADAGSRSDETKVASDNSRTVTPTPSPEVPAAAGVAAATKERMNRSATISAAADAGRRGDLVEVPAEAMQTLLISSRVPVYPDAARAEHLEGRVVMQAVVTKDGAVGHLHVASGDPQLRASAMEAVSAWRYRPYLVNGVPVDVSTTIWVDFLVDK